MSYGHLLTAMQERAAARGYRVVTATWSGSVAVAVADEGRALETLVGLKVEGLVVCSGLLPVADVLPHARRVPTVLAGRPARDEALSSVYCGELDGGRGMADHLWSLGHRRIAVVTLRPERSLTQAPGRFPRRGTRHGYPPPGDQRTIDQRPDGRTATPLSRPTSFRARSARIGAAATRGQQCS